MKNRKSIFAFFAICAAMIFASCSNLTDANVSSSSEDKNTLNIEVTNYDEVVTQASKSANRASRTIIPDSFDSDGVDFYLYGTNTSGGTFGPSKVDFKGNADAACRRRCFKDCRNNKYSGKQRCVGIYTCRSNFRRCSSN